MMLLSYIALWILGILAGLVLVVLGGWLLSGLLEGGGLIESREAREFLESRE